MTERRGEGGGIIRGGKRRIGGMPYADHATKRGQTGDAAKGGERKA